MKVKKSFIFSALLMILLVGVLGVVSASTVCDSGCDYTSIQDAIDAAISGDTIEVGAGTYTETLNLGDKTLTINGAGSSSTIIDASGLTGYAIQNLGDGSTISDLKLIGTSNDYGFKISHVSDITLENIKVEDSKKTGIDLNTIDGATLTNIEVTDTVSGFGLMILDSNDVTVTNIVTSGNAWAGVSVHAVDDDADTISFNGDFDVSEDVPLLLEKDSPYGDFIDVNIPDKFDYVIYGFRSPGTEDYKQWFYKETLEDTKALAQTLMSGWTYEDMIIYDIDEENYYVEEGMLIQDAIDAASEDATINVGSGEFAGAIIYKNVKIIGEEDGTSIITSGVAYKSGNSAYMTAFRPEADGAEIRYFTINCDISEDLGLGIYAVGVDDITVDSVTINNIGALQGITNWGGSNWIITNNIITDTVASGGGGIGIFLGAKAQQQCAGNLVQNNQISATATAEGYSTPGIFLGLDLRYGGYDLLDGTEDVSGNQILDNIITSSGAPSSVGIEVGSILGNSESDPDRDDPEKIAALMTAGAVHDNTLQDNIIDGAETGLYFYIVTDLTINQNEVKNSVENGIYAEYTHQGVVIQSNKFIDNLFQILDDSGTSLNTQNNYWGTDDGAEIAVLVSDDVDYIPWFTDEEMTSLSFGVTVSEPDENGTVEAEIPEEVNLTTSIIVGNETKNVEISIPAGVVVSTDNSSWDGTITPPTIKESSSVNLSISGLNTAVSKVIEIGITGIKLVFSKAVKIVIPGEAGKQVGYSYDNGATFTRILTVCGENSQDWADTLPEGEDCYIEDGDDMIVWTKHFTQFVTYNASDNETPILNDKWNYPLFPTYLNPISIFTNFTDPSGIASALIKYQYHYVDGTEAGNDLGTGEWINMQDTGDNIIWTYNLTFTPTPLNDGYFKIKFNATDGSGNSKIYPNTSSWEMYVTVDGTEPTTELLIGSPSSGSFITSTTEITINSTDPDLDDAEDYTPSGINYTEYKIDDGDYGEYSVAFTISGDDEDYTIYYKATDNAGNEESEKSTTLTLDNTAPVTTDDSNSTWTDSDATVALTPTDDGSGIASTEYCIDTDGTCTPDTEGTSVDVTCDADSVCEKYVRYYSKDNVDNAEAVKTSNVIRIDKQKTTTTLSLGTPNDDPYITSATEISLSCDDGSGSGCEDTYYKINGGDETAYSEAFTISGSDGDYIVDYYSVDTVGNIETTNQKTLTLDDTAPETTDDSGSYADWQSGDVTIILTPTDSGSDVASTKYCVDETGTCTPTTSGTSVSVTCAADTVCEQYVRYFSTDNVENAETVKTSGLIKIDKQNPVSAIASPEESSVFASNFDAGVGDSDSDGSGLATCEYQVTSNGVVTKAWTSRTCDADITITVGSGMDCRDEGDDKCKLEIRSTDSVGNVATVDERTFSIDYSNPPQVLDSGPSGTVINSWTELFVETNKPATCRYDTVFKSNYDSMGYEMDTTGTTMNGQTITGLTDKSYAYYVLCEDNVGNEMTTPVQILFDVDTREAFNVTIPETKGDYLGSGWNQFFLPSFVLENTTLEYNETLDGYGVEDVLESIEGSYTMLYHFDGNEWRTYVPGRDVNDLTHFNGGGFPYFIYMNVSNERIEIN